jgi:hypothetical protein
MLTAIAHRGDGSGRPSVITLQAGRIVVHDGTHFFRIRSSISPQLRPTPGRLCCLGGQDSTAVVRACVLGQAPCMSQTSYACSFESQYTRNGYRRLCWS